MSNLIIKNKLKEFISIFEIIENLTQETDITFSPEGMYIRAVHPSNHCLLSFKINKDMFEEYNFEKEETYTLNITLLNKILRSLSKNGLELSIGEDILNFKSKKKSFTLKYFVSELNTKERPNTITTSKWKVSSQSLFNHITDLIDFGSNCKIYGDEVLSIHIKSELVTGDAEVDAEKIESDGCTSHYDLSYLNMIRKSEELFKDLRIGFGVDEPLIVKGDTEHIDFEFVLAARAE